MMLRFPRKVQTTIHSFINASVPKYHDENVMSLNTQQTLYKSQSKILMEIFPNLEMLYILIHSLPNIPTSKILTLKYQSMKMS